MVVKIDCTQDKHWPKGKKKKAIYLIYLDNHFSKKEVLLSEKDV